MCGIFGFVRYETSPVHFTPDHQKIIFQSLRHRGPDFFGTYYYNHNEQRQTKKDHIHRATLSLLHTRLSIVDTNAYSHQPFIDDDLGIVLIFNGEIYNFLELKKSLQDMGYFFRTGSDTEVIVKSFHAFREKCFSMFEGMFSIAIFDQKTNKLYLARDIFGIKPLHYTLQNECIFFSSSKNALRSLHFLKFSLDINSVSRYIDSGTSDIDQSTFFQEIQNIQEGHYTVIDIRKNIHTLDFISFYDKKSEMKRALSWQDTLHNIFDTVIQSVNLHIPANQKYGILLSGGVDSSILSFGAHKLGYPLTAYSYIDHQESLSEIENISLHSKKYIQKNHYVFMKDHDLGDFFDKVLFFQEEPFNSPSILAQACLFETASKNSVKVMLSGQGADELFLGYESFYKKFLHFSNIHKIYSYVFMKESNQPTPRERLLLKVINKNILKTNRNTEILEIKTVEDLQQYGFSFSLKRLLRYEDRNAMMFSIENRVPYLTKNILELTRRIKIHHFVSLKGEMKYCLKRAFDKDIDHSILYAKKIGFESSWIHAFNDLSSHFLNNLTDAHGTDLNKFFNINILIDILHKKKFLSFDVDQQKKLWRILTYICWHHINRVTLP